VGERSLCTDVEPNLDVNRLKAKLESIEGLRLSILYGSLAEGCPRRSSDVDILVDCDEGSINELEELLCQEFRGREPHIVKVGWLRPEALLHTARRGIVLVDRDALRRLVAQVSPEYLELREGSSETFETWLDGDPIDTDVVMSIISQVEEDAEMLAKLKEGLNVVLQDPIQRRAFERTLHTAMEGMIDLQKHIVSRMAPGSFETYKELIKTAREKGIITQETSEILTALVDARNLLVHRYRGIQDQFLKENLNKVSRLWPTLKAEIRAYLKT